jgi:hypothetical protein
VKVGRKVQEHAKKTLSEVKVDDRFVTENEERGRDCIEFEQGREERKVRRKEG